MQECRHRRKALRRDHLHTAGQVEVPPGPVGRVEVEAVAQGHLVVGFARQADVHLWKVLGVDGARLVVNQEADARDLQCEKF